MVKVATCTCRLLLLLPVMTVGVCAKTSTLLLQVLTGMASLPYCAAGSMSMMYGAIHHAYKWSWQLLYKPQLQQRKQVRHRVAAQDGSSSMCVN
jgi:hypothetical protein